MLQLGTLYNPSRTSYPETTQLRLTPGFSELTMFLANPSKSERESVTQGPAQFAVIDFAPHLLMYGFQFGSQDWWDCPFEVQRMASDLRGIPGNAGEPLALTFSLIDASTGIVEGLRVAGLPRHFADTLRESVAGQLTQNYDPAMAKRIQDGLYAKYPTPASMFKDLADDGCCID